MIKEEKGVIYLMRSGDCVKIGKTTTFNIYGRMMSYVKDNPNLELICIWTMPVKYVNLIDIKIKEKIEKKYKQKEVFGKRVEWVNSIENSLSIDELIRDMKDITLKTGMEVKVWLNYVRGYNLDLNKMKDMKGETL